MNNSLIFSEESFELKKIKSNEHRQIYKASESVKNSFLYPNIKSKSFVTNFVSCFYVPLTYWHKKPINTYSMKQPDLYYCETIKMTS